MLLAQLVQCSPSVKRAVGQSPATRCAGVGACAYGPSTQESGASWLHTELRGHASLSHRCCSEQTDRGVVVESAHCPPDSRPQHPQTAPHSLLLLQGSDILLQWVLAHAWHT